MSELESSSAIDSLLLARSQRRPFAPSPSTLPVAVVRSSPTQPDSFARTFVFLRAPRLAAYFVFAKDRQTTVQTFTCAPLLTHPHTHFTIHPTPTFEQPLNFSSYILKRIYSAKAPKFKLRLARQHSTELASSTSLPLRSTSWPQPSCSNLIFLNSVNSVGSSSRRQPPLSPKRVAAAVLQRAAVSHSGHNGVLQAATFI